MNRTIPVINTARLTLRPMRMPDFDRYAEIQAQPACGGRDRAGAWDLFLRNAGQWQMLGFGQWAVTEAASRRMIGLVGFSQADSAGAGTPPEAGWHLAEGVRGRGYGPEAAQAAHDWFDRVIPGPLTCCVTVCDARSQHLARRLGYEAGDAVTRGGAQAVLLRRDRPPQRSFAP